MSLMLKPHRTPEGDVEVTAEDPHAAAARIAKSSADQQRYGRAAFNIRHLREGPLYATL
jgi:hypothetical protein